MSSFWNNFICGFFNLCSTRCLCDSSNISNNYKISKYLNAALTYYENEYKKLVSKK